MASGSSDSSSSNSNNPFGWLGLLKWSLAYSDGTSDDTDNNVQPMSDEDKKFLEAVMKDGIIDENERMKYILKEVTKSLEYKLQQTLKSQKENEEEGKQLNDGGNDNDNDNDNNEFLDENDICDLLLELRDIVEQIDYARAFMAMGGIQFLLGCSSQYQNICKRIRTECLGVLATMTQNNPPIQLDLVSKHDGIDVLTKLYFLEENNLLSSETSSQEEQKQYHEKDIDGKVRSKIIQAMSAMVRNHITAETMYIDNELARKIIDAALQKDQPSVLQKRTLFFLRALLTSDSSDVQRIKLFDHVLAYIITNYIQYGLAEEGEEGTKSTTTTTTNDTLEIREMTLELLEQMLIQKKRINIIMNDKDNIASMGVKRISTIRSNKNEEEKDLLSIELEHWESLMIELARGQINPNEEQEEPVPMLTGPPPSDTLAQ